MMDSTSWLIRKPQPSPQLRLICFPYAGGSAQAFASWQAALGPSIEVCAVQLPGREMRMAEAPITSLDKILVNLTRVLQSLDNVQFAFFGHSLGALVAFELTRLLRRHDMTMPCQLIVSGASAPRHRSKSREIHALPDRDLIEALRAYEGSPPEVLNNNELMELLLPMIRADFELGERYVYQPSLPLSLPITVFTGTSDNHVALESARQWREETLGECKVHVFEGSHFFIHTQRIAVLEQLTTALLEIQALA
jgi:surfactin synthase thioesterase subunit